LCFVGAVPGHKGVEHLIEESRRQEAVIIAIRATDLSKVIARPLELVAFGYNDPRAGVVESEWRLTAVGISTALAELAGGECVIGRTVTNVA
jgi:hypothetical protein